MNAEVRRRLARKLPKLRSIDDLLTPAEQEELRADLARIHDTVRPCWTDQRPQQSAAKETNPNP